MIRPVLIIKNVTRENPGLIEISLKEHDLEYQIVDFDDSTVINSINMFSALIVLGGPDSANDPTLKMQNELALIRDAIRAKIPYLGICLGLQTLVKATGGTVHRCQTKEVGFRDPGNNYFKINLTPEGRKDRLFDGLPESLTVFQLHGETVQLSPPMTLLATGDFCKNQIIRIGPTAYGIQSHLELTSDLLDSWIVEDSDLHDLRAEDLRLDFETIKSEYQNTGRKIFSNFFNIAGLLPC